MKVISLACRVGVLVVATLALVAGQAHAYVGPGGVVSGIGTLLALLAAIVVSVFGFVWFPVKRLVKRVRGERGLEEERGSEARP